MLAMPAPDDRGVVKTLNGYGWMQIDQDPYSKEFLEYLPYASGDIFEIGAAYGNIALEAVKIRRNYLANDLDIRHLEILRDRVPENYRRHLQLLPGAFPEKIELTANSIGAVLACRVLHFLSGENILSGLDKLFHAMLPGAKCFVVLQTPYNKRYLSTVTQEFESRRKRGDAWPGYFPDLKAVIAPEQREHVSDSVHTFTPETFAPHVERAGFKIEKTGFIARTDFSFDYQLDGREDMGMIFSKTDGIPGSM